MKTIATEEHMMTREVAEAWHRLELESRDPGVAYHRNAVIEERLLDLSDGRIALMDEAGIDVQVLSHDSSAARPGGRERRHRASGE